MSEVSKSLEAVNDNYGLEYSPESPAPEQRDAMSENALQLIDSAMIEIRKNVPGLTEEQYGEIRRVMYSEVKALLQSSQDVYGEPDKLQESEASKAFSSSSTAVNGAVDSYQNPYESQFK